MLSFFMSDMIETAKIVARHFMIDVTQISSLGAGRINDTYLVTNGVSSIVLRRINSTVFPRPRVVVENFSILTEHFSSFQAEHSFWPQALHTVEGQLWYEDVDGGVWHAQRYFALTDSAENVQNKDVVRACGACLAHFHQVAAEGLTLTLQEPLPYFHHLPFYLNHYDQIPSTLGSEEVSFCRQYILDNRDNVLLFTQLNRDGLLGRTVIHGDPKADNFVFCKGEIGLIDLDTAYFGSIHIDLGDALRSFCNPTGEDVCEPDFDVEVFRGFIDGYMSVLGDSLTDLQKEAIYDAVFALSFELGLRFFTDHLSGDSYFKVVDRGDNLRRAIIQFQLCQKIEEKKTLILDILKGYSRPSTVNGLCK